MTVFSSAALVCSVLAIALGLGAVAAGLAPLSNSSGSRPGPISVNAPVAVDVPVDDSASEEASQSTAANPVEAELPRFDRNGPWPSPLYPQNGVTLWDRIRSSASRSNRAFLLGTGIQVHAAATAATPDLEQTRQYCCSGPGPVR